MRPARWPCLVDDGGQFLPQGRQSHCLQQARQKAQASLNFYSYQPADVVAPRAQQHMQRIALRALEMAAVHSVIGLEVPDDRLDRV